MAFFDRVKRLSFDGVDIPVTRIEVVGGLRDHVHEYPHADGGAPEKLGRKLYVIRVSAIWDEGIAAYPQNYPDELARVREVCELGLTRDLVLPNLGTIKAYCRSWPQRWDAAVRSGETAEYEFVEDPQITNAGVFSISDVPTGQAMFIQLDHFNQEAALSTTRYQNHLASLTPGELPDLSQASAIDPSLLSKIGSAFTDLIALRDQELLYGALIEAKVAGVSRYADEIGHAITSPFDVALLHTLQDMVSAAVSFEANARNTIAPIKRYVVPRYMSATEISSAIFGDTSHASDILAMNPIADAFRISPGTEIEYIESSGVPGSLPLGNAPPFVGP